MDAVHEKTASGLSEIKRAGEVVTKDIENFVKVIKHERGEVERKISERPLVALGAAFGVGFVLGGGLASRIGGWLLVTGFRFAMAQGLRSVMGRIQAAATEPSDDGRYGGPFAE